MDSKLAALIRKLYQIVESGAGMYGAANSPMSPEHAKGMLTTIADFTPGVGDVKSAYDGVQSAREGDYLGAGLGALGALPMVPNLAGVMKQSRNLPVRPAKESLRDVADSNFTYGIPSGNKTVNVEKLTGSMSSASDDAEKVKSLVQKMSGSDGYIERLIVDQNGNVLEGQHRLNALRSMGVDNVPVSVITDHSKTVDDLVKSGLSPEHARNVVQHASDMVKESGSVDAAMRGYELPKGYERFFEQALKSMK